MNKIEAAVAEHYGTTGLLDRILGGLKASGADPERLQPDDLAPVEEFHIGGRKATAHAVAAMFLTGNEHVIDIGCGIGGAARYIAGQTGCRVTGIDLTPEYTATAEALTKLTGQEDKLRFETASALAMPFDDETFDAGITIHVAMNIPGRAALYGEIARVLKPGAVLCIFDVMKKNDEALTFPLPWAQTAETSHLTTPEETATLLADAGFELRGVEDRTAFALEFFSQLSAAAVDGPPPLGVHLVMGADAPEKLKNIRGNIEQGRYCPVHR